METEIPVKIGTKGTIGSLLSLEIEYFRRLELNRRHAKEDMGGSRPRSRLEIAMRKKSKKGCSWLLPSICSSVEIACTGKERLPSYKNLEIDAKEGE